VKLALGTVQFGLPYGVANTLGKTPESEVHEILLHARGCGIDTLDTAMSYGDSEAVLGRAKISGWRAVSKVGSPPEGCTDIQAWMESVVRASLTRMGIPQLHGLLLHQPQVLLTPGGDAIFSALNHLRRIGLTNKIGISIYDPSELDALIPRYDFGIVQAPFSIFDRRMIASGWMSRLAHCGVEIHVRSIFLQGLLLMPDATRPEKFSRWAPLWSAWRSWLEDNRLTPLEACVRFSMGFPEIERVIVGVDSLRQLKDICAATEGPLPAVSANLFTEDPDLLNPSLWSRL